MGKLIVESAQDASGRAGMVVLYEDVRDPTRAKGGLPERLSKEAPRVSTPRLLDQDEAGEFELGEAEGHGAGR